MTPPPQKAAPAFDSTWHETDVIFLNPTSLPLPKIPRAWERMPKLPFARDGKYKKVWRRYELRSQPIGQQSKPSPSEEEQEGSKSPARAVKKLRLKRGESGESTPIWEAKKPAFTATRWEWRKSVLPRKKPSHANDDHEDVEPATELDQYETGGAEGPLALMSKLISDASDGDASHEFPTEVIEAQMPTIADLHKSGVESCSSNKDFDGHSESPQEEAPFSSSIITSGSNSVLAESTSHILEDYPMKDEPESEDTPGSSAGQEGKVAEQETNANFQYPPIQLSCTESAGFFMAHDTIETGSTSKEHTLNQSETKTEQSVSYIPMDGSKEPEKAAREPSEEFTYNTEEENVETLDSSSLNFGLESKIDDNIDTDVLEMKELAQDIGLQSAETFQTAFAQKSDSSTEGNDVDELMYTPDAGEDVDITVSSEQPVASVDNMEEIEDHGIENEEQPEQVFRGSETPTTKESLAEAEMNESAVEQELELSAMPLSPRLGSEKLLSNLQDDTLPESIADGLTLGGSTQVEVAPISSIENTTRKLRSPSPPPPLEATQEDITTHLDDDTAILKDFLTRAAASKASKANKVTTIARRTSLSHRRDSDAVRHALASPRKILEDKDPNSPSPHASYDTTATFDLSESLTLHQSTNTTSDDHEPTDAEVAKAPATSSRRSTRSRSSRTPHPPPSHNHQPQTPNRIPVRRADGGEPVVLRRTEAQELGILTRANTRKNKSGAVAASVRLLKLAAEQAVAAGPIVDKVAEAARDGAAAGERKAVRWGEMLVYSQHRTDSTSLSVEELTELTEAMAQGKADVETLDPSPDEPASLGAGNAIPKLKSKSKDKAASTPRIRRLRGLGAANGTPGKGLLAPASLLPAEVLEEKERAVTEVSRLAKPRRARKLPVASESANLLETQPLKQEQEVPVQVGKEVKERKSRLATARKVKIPVSTTPAVPVDGKENRLVTGTPKKGVAVGVETGLPRRRSSKRL